MLLRLFLFLLLNFGGLAIGGLFTSSGVNSDWYNNLNQAPWTPPGWVFGAAWTTIMICFSIYLTVIWKRIDNKRLFLFLLSLLWLLNVAWNPIFFYYKLIFFGLLTISILTALIFITFFLYRKKGGLFSTLLLPYMIWLLIATSLNGYIFFSNP